MSLNSIFHLYLCRVIKYYTLGFQQLILKKPLKLTIKFVLL
jgi:hypothetical protein